MKITVDITEQSVDQIIREDLIWHALTTLDPDNDPHETEANKAYLFASLCKVIEFYSDKEQWRAFMKAVEDTKSRINQ